ncbi:hypothetical protein VNI00_018286 [Paramarasmius palmivorus]|uniref:Uncharacterized protein n=1 Tax=Paramarasmius palmivorus TaxID=297713 RepID=A0AAW0B0N0_9AGAR
MGEMLVEEQRENRHVRPKVSTASGHVFATSLSDAVIAALRRLPHPFFLTTPIRIPLIRILLNMQATTMPTHPFKPQEDDLASQDIRVLRFRGYNIERELRSENERRIVMENSGELTDELLDLEYEEVDEQSVPHIREQLDELISSDHSPSSMPRSSRKRKSSVSKPPERSSQGGSPGLSKHAPTTDTPPMASDSCAGKEDPQNEGGGPDETAKPGLSRKKRRYQRKTELARLKRKEEARARDAKAEVDAYAISVAQSSQHAVLSGFNAMGMPASKPGWIGTKEMSRADLPPVSKLRDFCWDGKVTVLLIDELDRIWTVLGAPPPRAKDWGSVNAGLMEALEHYDKESAFSSADMANRRAEGQHAARNLGVSSGGGQKQPGNIAIRGLKNQAAIRAFSNNQYLGRLVGHTGRLYATYANRLAAESRRVFRELKGRLPGLVFPLHPSPEGSYWAARCLNTAGTKETAAVVTVPHTDFGNWAPGWCCITAIGDFDPDRGGHLVLWNVGLKIRFPPGCSILFPSALITHSNVPIEEGERRYSIVEFTAGGLFRWVHNGYKNDEDLIMADEEWRLWEAERAGRWKKGVRLYTKLYELERGDYQGKVLEEESDLTDYDYDYDSDSDEERPSKRRRI